MAGMIEKSNRVLDQAAKMDRNASLSLLFQRAKGIILISVVESAMVVSGSVGSGICMTKIQNDGDNNNSTQWSLPCACGLTSTGWGFAMGAVVRDIIVFAFDDKSVQAMANKVGLKMNVGTSLTIGTYGVNAGANLSVSQSGAAGTANVAHYGTGGTVSIAFSKGAFVSAAVSGAIVGPRDHVNHHFYGDKKISAHDILFDKSEAGADDELRAFLRANKAEEMKTLEQVYTKLELLSKGANDAIVPEMLAETPSEEIPVEATNFIDKVAEEVVNQLDEDKPTLCEQQPGPQSATNDNQISGH